MLVSRKYLALIHVLTGKVPAGFDVIEFFHDVLVVCALPSHPCVPRKPLPKGLVKRCFSCLALSRARRMSSASALRVMFLSIIIPP